MPLYFPGFPASPLNSIQFNKAGAFGGDSNLTWDAAVLRNKLKELVGVDQSSLDASIRDYVTPTPLLVTALNQTALGIESQGTSGGFGGIYFVGLASFAGSTNIGMEVDAYAGAANTTCYGYGCYLQVNDGISATALYGYYIGIPSIGSGAALSQLYTFWSPALGGVGAANAYPFWADEQGVAVIKADNTFDSVYQAIGRVYNPLFTKYTAGSPNYERTVWGQWNGNVAEIGTEAGGTGVQRNLRLLGAAIQLSADTIVENGKALKTDATTAHTALVQAYDVDGAAYKTFLTLTNGNTPDMTIGPPAGATVTLQASTYKSSDGSTGATGSANATNTLTIKNGLVTAIA